MVSFPTMEGETNLSDPRPVLDLRLRWSKTWSPSMVLLKLILMAMFESTTTRAKPTGVLQARVVYTGRFLRLLYVLVANHEASEILSPPPT